MKSLTRTVCIILFGLVAAGCSGKRDSQESGSATLLNTYRLIDENRSEEAIVILEAELDRHPNDVRLQLALASAYSSLAGVDITKLFPSIENAVIKKDFKKIRDQLDKKRQSLKTATTSEKKAALTIESWVALFRLISLSFETFNQIIEVNPDKLVYLYEAIGIVENIERKSRGNYLFLAVLELVAFKNELMTSSLPKVISQQKQTNRCQVDVANVPQIAIFIKESIRHIVTNLAKAYPKQEKTYSEVASYFESAAQMLSEAAVGLSNADQLATALALTNGLEESVGTKLECNE